jgi:hypothetical protein
MGPAAPAIHLGIMAGLGHEQAHPSGGRPGPVTSAAPLTANSPPAAEAHVLALREVPDQAGRRRQLNGATSPPRSPGTYPARHSTFGLRSSLGDLQGVEDSAGQGPGGCFCSPVLRSDACAVLAAAAGWLADGSADEPVPGDQ